MPPHLLYICNMRARFFFWDLKMGGGIGGGGEQRGGIGGGLYYYINENLIFKINKWRRAWQMIEFHFHNFIKAAILLCNCNVVKS